MADNSRNSDEIADLVATPKIKGQPIRAGLLHIKIATVTMVTADSAPSLQTMIRIPAHARVKDLMLSSLDFSTAGAIDIGLHTESTPGVASTAVDADFFATAVDLSGGPYNKLSVLNESTTNTPAKQAQALWQAAGVTTEPAAGTFYLITFTVSTTFNSTGTLTLALEVEYVL